MVDRLKGLATQIRRMVGGPRLDAELDEELRFHVEKETEAGIARGLDPEEARRRALVKLGGVERHKEAARDERRVAWWSDLLRDVRLAVRGLGRDPGFAAAAILTLAVGLGGVVAGYGLVHGVLLRPLPYPDSHRLVSVWQTLPGWDRFPASFPIYERWREARTLETVAAFDDARRWVGGGERPERVLAAPSTWNLGAVLGVAPEQGRWFTEAEDRSGARVVVVSDGFRRERLPGPGNVVGATVLLDGEAYTVIGAMPPGFRFPDGTALWLPLGSEARATGWNSQFLEVVGRLAPGATVPAAAREIRALTDRAVAEGGGPEVGARVVSRRDDVTGGVRGTLLLAFGALAAVLLIGFLNVANLFLARRARQARGLAVRSALGAARWRLRRETMVEGVVVTAAGGLLGLFLSGWLLDFIRTRLPWELPRLAEVSLSPAVLGFAALLTLVLGVTLGLASSLGRLGGDTAQLQSGTWHTEGRRLRWTRAALVGVQVAAAFVLLTGATLLVRSLDRLLAEERGFDEAGVVALVEPTVPDARYPDDRSRGELFLRVAGRLDRLPGVEGAALALPLPFSGSDETASVSGSGIDTLESTVVEATAGYFDVLRIPVRAGRTFTAEEVAAGAFVAVLGEGLAERMGGAAVLGKQVVVGGTARQVIGVVADVRHGGLAAEPGPQLHIPFTGRAGEALSVVARAGGGAAAVPRVRSAVTAVEPALAATPVVPFETLIRSAAAPHRFRALLVLLLGLTAATLAAIGLYGVTALTMTERTRETAIRVALGARAGRAAASAVAHELVVVAAGLVTGAAGAVGLGHVLRRFLHDVHPTDPWSFGLTAAGVLALTLFAAGLPAVRAARGSPVDALKPE